MWLPLALAAHADDSPDTLLAPLAEIEATVAQLRGAAFLRPLQAEVLTADALRVRLDGMIDADVDADELAQMERIAVLAGLLPPSPALRDHLVDLAAGQIAGLYDPRTEVLSMVTRPGAGTFALLDRMLLAHEIAHALDDQHHDLEAIQAAHGDTLDGSAVASALVEGSATVQMMRFLAADMTSGRARPTDLLAYGAEDEARSKALLDAPRFYGAWLASGYFTGMGFLLGGKAPDGDVLLGALDPTAARFAQVLAEPPRTMEQVLHPEKYMAREAEVTVDAALAARAAEAAGLRLGMEDRLGELYVAVATTPAKKKLKAAQMAQPASWTNPAAEGWGGDRIWLLDGGDDAARGLWLTAWDTPEDREEFLKAWTKAHPLPKDRVVHIGETGAALLLGELSAEQVKAMSASLG